MPRGRAFTRNRSLHPLSLPLRKHAAPYGSCYCLSGGRSSKPYLDLIAQIEERHNVIVLRNGQPFFPQHRADLQAEGTLAPELWQGVEWRDWRGASSTYAIATRPGPGSAWRLPADLEGSNS